MPSEHNTHEFIVTQTPQGTVELWVDWLPFVDGSLSSSISARQESDDLVLEPMGETDPDRKVRRVTGLEEGVLEDMLNNGLVVLFCGPSGVLAEHKLSVATTVPLSISKSRQTP